MPKTKIKTIEKFASYVKIRLIETFPNCIIDVKNIKKDDELSLPAIVICKKDKIKNKTFAPIIYLEPYFAMLQTGTSLSDILDDIINDYRSKIVKAIAVNLDDITDFSLIKDKICFKLISKKFNNQILKTVPHRDFYDMAIIYYVNLSLTDEDVYTVSITNDTIQIWNVQEEQLYALALTNTPRLERGYVAPLCGTIKEMIGSQNVDDREHIAFKDFDMILASKDDFLPTYIATSKNRTNNAAVILYDGLLKSVSRQIGSFFVLPSSECECMLLPGTLADSERILQLEKSINTNVICEEDVLSENCFFYDVKSNSLKLIEK